MIQKFQIMSRWCLNIYLIFTFFISSVLPDDSINLVNIAKVMIEPQMMFARFPGKIIQRLPFENVTTHIQQITYELDYDIYARRGALEGDQAFKPQNYIQNVNYCKLYKTDLKLNSLKQKQLRDPNIDYLLFHYQSVQNGTISKIFTVTENNTVNVYKISINQEFNSLKVSQINWQITSTRIEEAASFKLDKIDRITFLQVKKAVYFLSNTSMILYRDPLPNEQGRIPLQQPVEGYVPMGEIISAGVMKDKFQQRQTKFYVLSQEALNIYAIESDLKINLLSSITDLKGQNKLENGIYDESLFYIVGVNSLYIVEIDGINLAKISKANLNGTCTFIEKFSTTLHITCSYQKINYVLELFAIGNNLKLNRYYADEDIRGRAISRRLGFGKMAIMTDQNIKFLNYGINRKILQERQTIQPQFVLNFHYGLQMLPIASMSNIKYTSLLLFTAQKMVIVQLVQIPPELYCQFPQQNSGVEYQILMVFNTSRCFYINNQDDTLFGSTETMCQSSYPVLIKSKKVQLQEKNTDFIQLILLILLLGIGLLVLAWFIKYHRSLDSRFNRMQKKLELMKMGFKKDKKGEGVNIEI